MWRLPSIALFAAAINLGPATADTNKCFTTWSEAAVVVRQEALVAVEEVTSLARASLDGAEVVKTTLCEEDGRYVYRLLVREAKGRLKTVSVDARKPFER